MVEKDTKKALKEKIIQAIRQTDWAWADAWEIFREAEFAYEKAYLKERGTGQQALGGGNYDAYNSYTYYPASQATGGVNSSGISDDFKNITKQVKEKEADDEKVLKDLKKKKKKHKPLDNKT